MSFVALGPAEASVEETITYVKERTAFGNPIAKYQGVSFKVAEMASICDIARWSCYRVLWMKDQGLSTFKESSMVKWWVIENSLWMIHQCFCIHGHYRYSREMPFERRLRDVIGAEIDDGTKEMQLRIIVGELLGKEYR